MPTSATLMKFTSPYLPKHLKQIVERQFVLDFQSFNAYLQHWRTSSLIELLLFLLVLLLLQLLQRLLL